MTTLLGRSQDPNAKVIRELQEELERLRSEVAHGGSGGDTEELQHMRDRLTETESLMKEMELTWEEKLKQTEQILLEKQKVSLALLKRLIPCGVCYWAHGQRAS